MSDKGFVINAPKDRSEVEHKELIKTANDGMVAIHKLAKDYSDVTTVRDEYGNVEDMDASGDAPDYMFEIKS